MMVRASAGQKQPLRRLFCTQTRIVEVTFPPDQTCWMVGGCAQASKARQGLGGGFAAGSPPISSTAILDPLFGFSSKFQENHRSVQSILQVDPSRSSKEFPPRKTFPKHRLVSCPCPALP